MSNKESCLSSAELSSLIAQIYSATLTRCWDAFLNHIIEITQSNKAFFLLQKLDTHEPALLNMKINFDYNVNVLNDYYSRPEQDPLYQLIKDIPQGEVIYCNEHINVDEFIDTEYFRAIYQPMRTYHALSAILIRDGIYDSNFIINRGPDDQPYQDKEKNLLELLTPHLTQAMQIFKTLQLHKDYLNLNQSVMDQSDTAIFICDQHGKILLHNALADTLLTNAQLFSLENNALVLLEPTARHRFTLHMQSCALFATSDIYCKEAIVLDQQDGTSVTISVAPLRGSQDFTRLPKQTCLVTAAISNNLDWVALAREFGLTKAETRLLQALYQKKKLRELTNDLGVSYNTLRTHLQAIFKKIGVNSQTELMVKLNCFV